jgi:hypothetical protein
MQKRTMAILEENKKTSDKLVAAVEGLVNASKSMNSTKLSRERFADLVNNAKQIFDLDPTDPTAKRDYLAALKDQRFAIQLSQSDALF